MAITATVDAANARVDLFVDWTPVAGTQTVSSLFRRVGGFNAPDEYVRGLFGTTLLGEQAYVSDHEAPLDKEIWYVATADNTNDFFLAGPFTIPSDGNVWLKDPGRPWADLKLDLCSNPSGADPCPAGPVVLDTFGRVVASAWGTTDTGQAWTTGGGVAANFSVNGTIGLQTQTTVASTRIATVTSPLADLDVTVDVGTNQTALTSSLLGGPLLRSPDNSNMYGVMVEFTTSGTITLSLRERAAGVETVLVSSASGLVYAPNSMFRVRFQAQGNMLRARVWPVAGAEPDAWLIQSSDNTLTAAGRVGLRSFTAAGNTNASPSLLFDNLSVSAFDATVPHPADLAWVGFRDVQRESDAGLFPVLDKERPANVFARRKDVNSSILFLSRSLDAIDRVYELFTAGGPVLIQLPAVYGMEPQYGQHDRYYQPDTLTEQRLANDQRKPPRLWSAPVTAVDLPVGLPQGTDTANWCALEETYATYADFTATGYSWGQVAEGEASLPPTSGLYGGGTYGGGFYGG
jgi:hypothetical protein